MSSKVQKYLVLIKIYNLRVRGNLGRKKYCLRCIYIFLRIHFRDANSRLSVSGKKSNICIEANLFSVGIERKMNAVRSQFVGQYCYTLHIYIYNSLIFRRIAMYLLITYLWNKIIIQYARKESWNLQRLLTFLITTMACL